ncbi:MAG: hypothetical protein JNL74_20435, partial [Fibrobacteres bacterium]|nr:hypothetical protein [Fibrobacterota bacterium]
NIWLGLDNGLFRYQKEGERWTPILEEAPKDILLNGNDMFVATNSALFCTDIRYMNWKKVTASAGLASDTIIKLAADLDYIYAASPGGISRMDISQESWEPFNSFPGESVADIYTDQDNLWVATDKGLHHYEQTYQKWEAFHTEDGLSENKIQRLFYFNNALYLVHDKSLTRYNERMKSWTVFDNRSGLPGSLIKECYVDGSRIWIGTDAGVFRFSSENETWENFSKNTPLDSTTISKINSTGAVHYFATKNGLYSYTEETRKWTKYNTNDGLCGDMTSSVVSAGGIVFSGGADCFSVFFPEENIWRKKNVKSSISFKALDRFKLTGRAYFKVKTKADIPGPLNENIPYLLFDAPKDSLANYNYFMYWWTKAYLGLNGDLGNKRNILASYDNTDPASSNLRYSAGFTGAESDLVREISLNSHQKIYLSRSKLITPSYVKGGEINIEPSRRFKTSGWGGESRTLFEVMTIPFQEDNFYFLDKGNIISETVELLVDGQHIDQKEYSLERKTGVLSFKDESIVNPLSNIEISFQYEPSGSDSASVIAAFEEIAALSERYSFGATALNKMHEEPDLPGTGTANNRITVGSVNGEINIKDAGGTGRLSITPEIALSDNDSIFFQKQGHAAHVNLVGSINNVSIKGEGRYISPNFTSNFEPMSIYGRVRNEASATLEYKRPQLTATMWGRGISASDGNERSIRAETQLSLKGLPTLKLRGMMQNNDVRERQNARVETDYETPEELCKKLHIARLNFYGSYDFDNISADSSETEMGEVNHNLFAKMRLYPDSRVMLEAKTVYRQGVANRFKPEVSLFIQDFFPGIKLFSRLNRDITEGDSADNTDNLKFNSSAQLVPGYWLKILNPFQLDLTYSKLASNLSDTVGTNTNGFSISPKLFILDDSYYNGKFEFSKGYRSDSLTLTQFKVRNNLNLNLRNRNTLLFFEYTFTGDSVKESAALYETSRSHSVLTRWTEKWLSGQLRSELKAGASRVYGDSIALGKTDGCYLALLCDWRTNRFLREIRIQEQVGPVLSEGRGLELGSYSYAFQNKLDVNIRAGNNFYARILLNLSYLFDDHLLKYDLAEFKLTAVF